METMKKEKEALEAKLHNLEAEAGTSNKSATALADLTSALSAAKAESDRHASTIATLEAQLLQQQKQQQQREEEEADKHRHALALLQAAKDDEAAKLSAEIEELKDALANAHTAASASTAGSAAGTVSEEEAQQAAQRARDEAISETNQRWQAEAEAAQADAAKREAALSEQVATLTARLQEAEARAAASSSSSSSSSGSVSADDIKDIMQDVYVKACEIFVPEDEDAAAAASYSPKDVVKRLRAVLKAVTSQRTPSA